MAFVNKSITIPYSTQQIYNLVQDIEKYPEFVDWCIKGEILDQTKNQVQAALTFKFNGKPYTFATQNTLSPYQRIDILLIQGPFKKLCGHWDFQALNENWCKITLNLEFEFSIASLSFLFNPIFTTMAHKWVDSFCQRAKDLYD